MKAIYNGIKFVDIAEEVDLPTDFDTDRIPNKGDIMSFRCLNGNDSTYHHCEVLYVYDEREGWEAPTIGNMQIKTVSIYVITRKINPKLGDATWKSIQEIISRKSKIENLIN